MQSVPKTELAAFIRAISQWSWPRSELHVWFGVLDRFDEIMATLITEYDAANLQLRPFSQDDKELLFQILRFERMLLDNSTNRKLFNSYDRLSVLVMSPDVDIAIEALSLILRPAHQYTLQLSLHTVLRVNHTHLETLAQSWPVTREHGVNYVKLVSSQSEPALPAEASDLQFQWYPPKVPGSEVGPYTVHLKSLASDPRDVVTITQDAINGRPIGVNERFELLCKIRMAKSLGTGNWAMRSKLIMLRMLAIAVYCHTHTDTTGQNAKLLLEPDIVSSVAPLLATDKGIDELLQAAAVHALDALCHHRFRSGEVLTAVNASVAHGLLMSLFRKTVAKLEEAEAESVYPLFEALQIFLDFLTTHEVSYNMVISAGLIDHLRKVVSIKRSSYAVIVAKTIPLLENALYGPPQGPSSANQRNNNPFTVFLNDGGIQFLLERIKWEVETDIVEYSHLQTSDGPPLGYGRVPTPRINVLKHLLRTIQRMLQSTGSAEVLRLLPENDSAFIPSLKSILDNRNLFGSTILAAATIVIATWVHNDPSALTIIQESGLPESFYSMVEHGLEPMIEVVHGVLNAMGALSLNQAGQTLLEARSKVISTVFGIFTSDAHASSLQEKSNASLIGGDVDELVRHHPWLKPIIFKGVIETLDAIEQVAKTYTPREEVEGYFNLLAVNEVKMDAEPISTSGETSTLNSQSGVDVPASAATSSPSTFELSEMLAYQYLSNFSKFLVGFFSHAQHCRDILSETSILTRLDSILALPSWPIDFVLARNLDAVLLVNRRLMDASPAVVLTHRVGVVKKHLESTYAQDFLRSRGASNTLVNYVNVTDENLAQARSFFTNIRRLLLDMTLLNDVYSQSSSHSIHQPFRREPINMLEPLVEDPTLLMQIGRLSQASAWEILHLKAQKTEVEATATSGSVDQPSSSAQPTEQSIDPPVDVGASVPELLDEQRTGRDVPAAKDKNLTVEQRNQASIKTVLHAFSNITQTLFSGFAKALTMPRRLPSTEASKFKKDSKEVARLLAEALVEGLRSYNASDDPVVVIGFCALAISITSCIGPENRHGQNIQTGLFLEFEKCGGIEAVIQICTFCADLIDRVFVMKDEDRPSRDKEALNIAHYFLRQPMIWFYHLVSGKPLAESPQTLEILRFKTYEGFDPSDTLVQLRLTLLPLFRRFWEAEWLRETSESVRKSVIFGLLAILKGEYEDSGRLASASFSMPGHPIPMPRRMPVVPSPAMIQQLTDMGFPEAAARNALMRARGDLSMATELLLTNAHFFDNEGDAPASNGNDTPAAENANPPTTAAEPNSTNEPAVVASEANAPSTETTPAADQASTDPTPEEPKRDFVKELAEAREQLKETIVPTALRLADANPAFIDDIQDIFFGSAMNGNAKYLAEDIKKYANGTGEVPEVPLQVRCRILSMAYFKVGEKSLGLSKEDSEELLKSLLALLLSTPIPSAAPEHKVPKWLASHLWLSKRILCTAETIAPISIPKDDEPIVNTDLFVGPSFTSQRKVLFDFCMRLLRVSDLQREDLLSLFHMLAFLTRDHDLALQFIKQSGLSQLLQYFKANKQQEDVSTASVFIFRHLMEDKNTVEKFMRNDLRRWTTSARSRSGESVSTHLKYHNYSAFRDPQLFLKVSNELCELAEPLHIGGGYRIRSKAEDTSDSQPAQSQTEAEKQTISEGPFGITPEDAIAEVAVAVINQLTTDFIAQHKQAAEQPPATSSTIHSLLSANVLPPSAGTSGVNTPVAQPEPRPVIPPESSSTSTKEVEYTRFIQGILCELLLCFEPCKIAFLAFPKRRLPNLSKDGAKHKPLALNFVLQEIISAKADTSDSSRKRSKLSPYQSLVVALCSDANPVVDAKDVTTGIQTVRKLVLDTILKTLKEPISSTETSDQRYTRYIALGDLCQKVLTVNLHTGSQKNHEDSLTQIAELMLEKNYVAAFSSILSEVDLAHPMSSVVTSSILAPLETLTKASIRIGRSGEPVGDSVPFDITQAPEFSTESEEESDLLDSEETPDPYSTSALGMYGGETDGAFADVEEPMEEEEEDDVEMDYAEDEYDTEESQEDADVDEGAEMESPEDADPNDEDTDLEDDEEMSMREDEEHGEEDLEDHDEDDEGSSLSDEDDPESRLEERVWQEIQAREAGDEEAVLLQPGDEEDDLDGLDPTLDDPLADFAYELNDRELVEAPVYVHPPQPMGELLEPPGDRRFPDISVLLDGPSQIPPGFPAIDITSAFDIHPDEFARLGHRRAYRRPQIVRTSMLQEMLGAPTAQMIHDMARASNGELQLALSGPAAQLLLHGAGLDGSQFRQRMMSRYMTIRPGHLPGGQVGLPGAMPTTQRWAEEARENAGASYENRLVELANHLVVTLLPASREAAKLRAEEAMRKLKEAEEKEKEETRLRQQEEEAERAEAERRRQQEEEAARAMTVETPETAPGDATQNAQATTMDAIEPESVSMEASTSNAEASTSNNPPRVTVMYRGEEIDITDADIDPEFLNAVPEDIRDEILGNFVRERQRESRPTRIPEAEMDMEFLNALPAEIRDDVLRNQAIAQIANAVDMDPASVLATLPEELRQTVLLEQDDAILESMPSAVLAEANALRHQIGRRSAPSSSLFVPGIPPPTQQPPRKPQYREVAQLLEKPGLLNLVKLLFFVDQTRRTSLQQVIVNLSQNGRSRTDLFKILLSLLHTGKSESTNVDKGLAQPSVRPAKPTAKGKQKEDQLLQVNGVRAPEEQVVVQRTLDTLMSVVLANEMAPLFFLTEQDASSELHRAHSKKGKGKEKQIPGAHYPFVQLLALLERHNLLQQAHSLDTISGLLSTITKPLTALREKDEKSLEEVVPKVAEPVPPSAQARAVQEIPVVEPAPVVPETAQSSSGQPKESSEDEVAPKSREEIIRANPPNLPDSALRLVVNLLTFGECSSRCFQNTQALIFNLSSLPSARDVIIDELKTKAEEFGRMIHIELEALLRSVNGLRRGEDLPSSITTKFSLPTSNQARLLRILKILENIYMPVLPGRSSAQVDTSGEDERIIALFERLHFAPLWKKLSDCLKSVEDRPDATHVATFLLPLMESLMVVCKSTASQAHSTTAKAMRASMSPRSPTLDRESSGDVFVAFTDKHRKVLNLMVRNKPSLMFGSFSLLVHNPRVLDFDNKRNYFTHKLRHRSRAERERETYPTIPINVRRAKVFEDSFQAISRLSDKDLKYGKLNVRFSNEEGVDAGGVTREWFRILAREIFNPNYALFSPCGADRLTYQPNPASWINPDHLRYFKFVGRILGKAIYDQRLLDGHFARSVYRQLLGKPVNYRDLEWSDPSYYSGLRWMLDNSVEAMDLTFSEQSEQLGEMVVVDLKPNGRNIAVTDENKDEYIQLIAEYRLTTSIKDQLQAFLEGFYEIVPKEHISVFDEKELELLISGTPDIEVEDWRSATEYHGYSASDAVILWWWRALKSFSRADRAKVLSFATGTAKVPLGGFAELQGVDGIQRFSIHKDYGAMDRLPQAHTCFNQIDLPQYSSYEKLRQQLLLAINEGGEGFGFA